MLCNVLYEARVVLLLEGLINCLQAGHGNAGLEVRELKVCWACYNFFSCSGLDCVKKLCFLQRFKQRVVIWIFANFSDLKLWKLFYFLLRVHSHNGLRELKVINDWM